jgi:hypothetical protein
VFGLRGMDAREQFVARTAEDSTWWKSDEANAFRPKCGELTERARARAPQILAYAAAPGAAMLVAPSGAVVPSSGEASDVDACRVGHAVTALGANHEVSSFRLGTTCVHAAPVGHGFSLCILSTAGVHPSFVIERLRRARHVLALALADGVGPGSCGSGSGGSFAAVFAAPLPDQRS